MAATHSKVMQGFPPTRESQVTFANYLQLPCSTWGFRNMDSTTHTTMLPRGGDLPELKRTDSSDLGDQIVKDSNGEDLALNDLLEKYNADGFLVFRIIIYSMSNIGTVFQNTNGISGSP
jgi:hypothetical protein